MAKPPTFIQFDQDPRNPAGYVIRPSGYLGGSDFDRYRSASASVHRSGWYDRDRRIAVVPNAWEARRLLEALQGVGFVVKVFGPDVSQAQPPKAAEAVPDAIEVRNDPENAGEYLIAPSNFLGGEGFNLFRQACKNVTKFVQRAMGKFQSAPSAEDALECINRLQAAGFLVRVQPEAYTVLKRFGENRDEAARQGQRGVEQHMAYVKETLARSNTTLRPYQEQGVRWMFGRDRLLLADDQGTGKTIQLLSALPPDAPVVVVCPKSVMGMWKNESGRLYNRRARYHRSADTWAWPQRGEVVVMNYAALSRSKFTTGPDGAFPGTVLIADEAFSVKGSSKKGKQGYSERSHQFSELVKKVFDASGKVWMSTGTPVANNAMELWNLLSNAQMVKASFGTYQNFKDVFKAELWTPPSSGPGSRIPAHLVWGLPDPHVIAPILAKIVLRRLKTEVWEDMPQKIHQVIPVLIEKKEQRKLDQFWDKLTAGGFNPDILDANKVPFEKMSEARNVLAMAKIPAMLEMVEDFEERGEPVVVFSCFLGPIQELAKRPGWGVLTGSVSIEKRVETIADFQAGKLKGIAITLGTGKEGITLHRASSMIIVDRSYTPADNKQAEDRIHRIGQVESKVHYYLLEADHLLDKNLNKIIEEKSQLFDAVLDAGRSRIVDMGRGRQEDVRVMPQLVEGGVRRLAAPRPISLGDDYGDGGGRGSRPADDELPKLGGPARPAKSALEEWAMRGLEAVVEMDPDRAREENGIGFSKFDGGLGHRLAMLTASGNANDDQWEQAVGLARKYRGQIVGAIGMPSEIAAEAGWVEKKKPRKKATKAAAGASRASGGSVASDLGAFIGGAPSEAVGRPASNNLEAWAGEGIEWLAEQTTDSDIWYSNSPGFSPTDRATGRLHAAKVATGRATDEDWKEVVHLARRYMHQIVAGIGGIGETWPIRSGNPLRRGSSREAFSWNVREMMHTGRPQKQAVAIAYATRRRTSNPYPSDEERGAAMFARNAEMSARDAEKLAKGQPLAWAAWAIGTKSLDSMRVWDMTREKLAQGGYLVAGRPKRVRGGDGMRGGTVSTYILTAKGVKLARTWAGRGSRA